MTARAEVEFGFGGIRGGIKDLGDLRDALAGVEGASKRLGASYKGLKNLWEDPSGAKGGWSNAQRVTAGIVKMAAEMATAQGKALYGATIAPATTTYEQALGKFNAYRNSAQRIATATGESFGAVDKRIMDTSKRLGILPQQVQAYGMAIRNQAGGTVEEALSGIEAAQNRALKTGQSIEDLIGPMTQLRQTFGIKSTQEVNQFFGNLDAQANKAKVTAEVAGQAFAASVGMLSRISEARPAALSAFTTQFQGNAVAAGLSPQTGEENAQDVAGFLRSKVPLLERLALKRGLLKKGEHLTRGGRFTTEGLPLAAQLAQQEMARFYGRGGKDSEQIGIAAELSGEMPAQVYDALRRFSTGDYRKTVAGNAKASDQTALDQWLASGAGGRQAGEAGKERRDLGLGGSLIGAQDAAVLMGGGAGGIALAASGEAFSRATDIFGAAVDRFVGGLGGRVATATGAATGTAVATGAGATAGSAAARGLVGNVLPKVAAPLALATVATMAGDTVLPERTQIEDMLDRRRAEAASLAEGGRGHWSLASLVGLEAKDTPEKAAADIAQLTARLAQLDAQKIGDAVAKGIASQTLRTQSVQPPQSPPGQPVSNG